VQDSDFGWTVEDFGAVSDPGDAPGSGAASDSSVAPAAARLAAFTAEVWEYHRQNRRDLPWRRTHDPYEILVSEFMLQQTQVARVLEKYPAFLADFPTGAETGAVLSAWSGLGYNRRALALHRAAQAMVAGHGGRVPSGLAELLRLPGVGAATAAAVSAFAFGRAEPFIETNIRAAYIHFFFSGVDGVADADILPLVTATMDHRDPREWFYALMDYGVWVKKTHKNPSRRSKHHAVQSPFAGSRRETRAQVLQVLLAASPSPKRVETVTAALPGEPREAALVRSVLDDLVREGFLAREGDGYRIAG
jgi:A/G-specific adenine glycosylase